MSHLPTRVFWYAASIVVVNLERVANQNASIGAAILLFSIGLISSELIFYVQIKAQVKLFLLSKVNKFQEQ